MIDFAVDVASSHGEILSLFQISAFGALCTSAGGGYSVSIITPPRFLPSSVRLFPSQEMMTPISPSVLLK